jgi:hypothetical protein
MPSATADAAAVARAVARALALHAAALSADLDAIAADHEAHLAALGAAAAATPSEVQPSPSGIDGATLADQERAGSAEALADVPAASPAVAVLLTEIAASRAAHADRLAATGPFDRTTSVVTPTGAAGASAAGATPSGTRPTPVEVDTSPAAAAERDALGRVVADAHAAVYGYGVVAATATPTHRENVRAAWDQVRVVRDRYTEALVALGGRAPAALPGYRVEVSDPADPLELAARLESGLTTRLVATVAQASASLRPHLAADAVDAARRAQAWGAAPAALPGAG